jgi:hypothetical protein
MMHSGILTMNYIYPGHVCPGQILLSCELMSTVHVAWPSCRGRSVLRQTKPCHRRLAEIITPSAILGVQRRRVRLGKERGH